MMILTAWLWRVSLRSASTRPAAGIRRARVVLAARWCSPARALPRGRRLPLLRCGRRRARRRVVHDLFALSSLDRLRHVYSYE